MKISVKVISRAKQEKIFKLDNGSYKIWVSTPREKGRANERVIEILAEYFGKPKSQIAIRRGQTSQNKILEIT